MNEDAAAVPVTLEVTTAPRVPTGPLPRTGSDVDVLVAAGLALVLIGVLFLLIARTHLESSHA